MVMMTKVYFHAGIQGHCTHRPVSVLIFIVEGRIITTLPLQSAETASCTSCLIMKTIKGNYKQENAFMMYSEDTIKACCLPGSNSCRLVDRYQSSSETLVPV
jgi:hypothetical protein